MNSDSATTAEAAITPAPLSQEEATNTTNQLPSKIDPITAVQDSIDSLALSLFEALRGVRDAVAPESLEAPGSQNSTSETSTAVAMTALQEAPEEMEKDATATERLLNGVNTDYFPPRAFDLLEPDYDAFIMAYLSENPYAKELVERFDALESKIDDLNAEKTKENSVNVEVGDVGYEFRKEFDAGWYTGKVIEIRLLAANGYDRRCVYSDGDIEDLRLEDLEQISNLDPNNKKRRQSVKLASQSDNLKTRFPLTQAEYTKLLLDTEHRRDVRTTQLLAQDILAKSAAVDDLVAKLPGMNRTRQMQMERINDLIKSNHNVTREMEEAYVVAKERREEVREALGESTCLALGVEEDI